MGANRLTGVEPIDRRTAGEYGRISVFTKRRRHWLIRAARVARKPDTSKAAAGTHSASTAGVTRVIGSGLHRRTPIA
jgi:hypothetical protein